MAPFCNTLNAKYFWGMSFRLHRRKLHPTQNGIDNFCRRYLRPSPFYFLLRFLVFVLATFQFLHRHSSLCSRTCAKHWPVESSQSSCHRDKPLSCRRSRRFFRPFHICAQTMGKFQFCHLFKQKHYFIIIVLIYDLSMNTIF